MTIQENIKRNEKYLILYANELKKMGQSVEVIEESLSNVNTYINEYLNYWVPVLMEDGSFSVLGFFHGWYIEKKHCPSIEALKAMGESIKDFYKCMKELGYVTKSNSVFIARQIDANMEDFIDTWKCFENGTYYQKF